MSTQGCGAWVTWDTYSKKLFRHVVHLGLPPAPAVRRTREPSLRAPGGPEHRRRNGRLTHTTGHRSAATLVVSSASAPTCDYHTPHSPLPKPHLPVWSPCSISRRLWPAGPRASWLHRQRLSVRTRLGQRTTRPAHESRQPAPPTGAASATPSFCTRHCGATTDALRSPLQPCPGRSRRVRAVRGPYCVLGDGRLGVEPLRPERCTTMSVRRSFGILRAPRVPCPCAVCPCLAPPARWGSGGVAGRCG